MRNMTMTPSPLKRESFASSNQSSCGSLSMSGSFDSSFGSSASSATTWDQCYTPSSQDFSLSRRQSSGSIDMDMLSSSRSSLTGSVSPSEDMFFHPMTTMASMNQNMLTSMAPHDNFVYSTPCGKGSADGLMQFEFQQHVNNMYSPIDSQDYLCDMPTLSFSSSSPMPLGSSPNHYVDPLQTTFEPLCPSTPIHVKSTALGSPLADYGSGSNHTPYIQHFMSPPNAYTPSHSSPLSIKSESTLRRTPSSMSTLESSSAALHRIQSSGASRIRKTQRKPQFDFVAAGSFRCDVKGCKSQHPFKRQEHLKRHKKTHLEQKDLICEFCSKKFQLDRTDNYRSHVKLHAKANTKGARTKYFPGAEEMVRRWDQESQRKKGNDKLSAVAQSIGRNTRRSAILQNSPDLDY